MRKRVLSDVSNERDYQEGKWGNEFDDKNTVNDWVAYIAKYSSNAAFASPGMDQRTALVKAAALAVAAVEAFDRNDGFPLRHYDKPKSI